MALSDLTLQDLVRHSPGETLSFTLRHTKALSEDYHKLMASIGSWCIGRKRAQMAGYVALEE